MISELYVFKGIKCLFSLDDGEILNERHKLLLGSTHSIKNMLKLMGSNGFSGFVTDSYSLSYFETPSNVKIIAFSKKNMIDLRPIYELYVKCFVRSYDQDKKLAFSNALRHHLSII